jgi:hypothetical protein
VALILEPVEVEGPDAGVIEEARARQRRRWGRAAAAATVFAAAVAAGVLVFGGGRSGNSNGATSGQPVRLTIRHGYAYVNGYPVEVGVAPSLSPGTVGLDVAIAGVEPGGAAAGGDARYPTAADPIFGPNSVNYGSSGEAGKVYLVLVGPSVAEMRVSHLGTFKPVKVRGLLAGQRAIAFYRPAGTPGTVFGPGTPTRFTRGVALPMVETLYNAAGKQIPLTNSAVLGFAAQAFHTPIARWHTPATAPVNTRCATSSSLPGATPVGGEAATAIAADHKITGPAFYSCLDTLYTWHGAGYTVGILLNAENPGAPPAPIWNAHPIPGHPGLLEVNGQRYADHYLVEPAQNPFPNRQSVTALRKRLGTARADTMLRRVAENLRAHNRHIGQQRVSWTTLSLTTVARRIGNAWLVVRADNYAVTNPTPYIGRLLEAPTLLATQYGALNVAHAIQFLDSLRITRLNVAD